MPYIKSRKPGPPKLHPTVYGDNYVAIRDFLPFWNFHTDERYQTLTARLSDREVEFCKYMHSTGKCSDAFRRMYPDCKLSTARTSGGRIYAKPEVKDLVDYFASIKNPLTHTPVTLDEIVEDIEKAYRETNDRKEKLALAADIVKYRRLDQARVASSEDFTKESCLQLMDILSEDDEESHRLPYPEPVNLNVPAEDLFSELVPDTDT